MKEEQIRAFFSALYRAWGRQHWWPAETPFEVIVGAFLTQNTAWTNVERALEKLREAQALSLDAIRMISLEELEQLIRSAGYFRQKAKRLKVFVGYLDNVYDGSLDRMFARPTFELRAELLTLTGIGPETADTILLYAGQHELFVVDAYARRILERHGLVPATAKYEEVQQLVQRALTLVFEATNIETTEREKPPGAYHASSPMSKVKSSELARAYNELHALFVGVGKNFCRSRRVHCEQCPLGTFLTKPVKLGTSIVLPNIKP
jgi:endonuclease-3 related protein